MKKEGYLPLVALLAALASTAFLGCAPKTGEEAPAESAKSAFDPNAPIVLETADDFSDSTPPQPGEAKTLTLNGVDIVFHYIPAGSFTMGEDKSVWEAYVEKSGQDKESSGLFMAAYDETPHEVAISKGYWLAETEMTQEAWEKLTGTDPAVVKGADFPVTRVKWDDCAKLVANLNAIIERPQGWKFALPTEAQWEYACRAGSTTIFALGDTLTENDARCTGDDPKTANEKLVGNDDPVAVGSYPANPWGLKDMHGNVWEWCADFYAQYPNSLQNDPKGPEKGDERVARGGCWNVDSFYCRSARRSKTAPSMGYSYIGMRLALVAE